jgi:hypothetical protein
LPQTDTFLKQAISLIPEAPTVEEVDYKKTQTEVKLTNYLKAFLSLLVVVPGSPEYGPFYLAHGLLKAVPRFQWRAETGNKVRVFIHLLSVLSAFSQKRLPYSIENVDSNDTLNGGSQEYHDELNELVSTVMQDIIQQLTAIGEMEEKNAKVTQAEVVMELVVEMLNIFDLAETMFKFIKKLLGLCEKNSGQFTKKNQERYAEVKLLVETRRSEVAAEAAEQ